MLSRPACTLEEKFQTHLRADRALWQHDVMQSFLRADHKDPFEIGYHMHLMTDIFFRDQWEARYVEKGVPTELWDATAYRAASYGVFTLLEAEISQSKYAAWIAKARTYQKREGFPFSMTSADMDAEIVFSADISPYQDIVREKPEFYRQPAQFADFADIYREAIPHLHHIFGEYLSNLS